MIQFPRLKTFLTVFPLPDATWGLRGGSDEQWRIKLTDERAVRAFAALLPHLDGRTATDDILAALERAGIQREAALAVLRHLETSSLIEEADDGGLSPQEIARHAGQIRFFSRFTPLGGARLQALLRDTPVALLADGELGASAYRRLAGAGFGDLTVLCSDPARVAAWADGLGDERPGTRVLPLDREAVWPAGTPLPRVLVVCEEAHDPLLLEAVDALSKRAGLPWLLVRSLDLKEGWVGPLFVPGETASYLSLEARLRANLPRYPEFLAFDAHVRAAGPPGPLGGLRAAFDLLTGVAVIELIKFVTEIKVPQLLGQFLTVNFWTWETELHEVLRLPTLDRGPAPRPPVFPRRVLEQDDGARSPGAA